MATLNWVCKDFVFFSCRARLDHLRWRVNLSGRRYLIALSPFLWLNPTKFHPFFDWVCNLFPSERSPLAWKYPSQATHPHAHPAPPYPSTYPPTLPPRTPAYPHHRLTPTGVEFFSTQLQLPTIFGHQEMFHTVVLCCRYLLKWILR